VGGRRFTPEEDETLRELSRQGLTLSQVARILGRNKQVVSRRAQRLGVSFEDLAPPWTDEETELLDLLLLKGFTYREIAEILGRTRWGIIAKTKELKHKNALSKEREDHRVMPKRLIQYVIARVGIGCGLEAAENIYYTHRRWRRYNGLKPIPREEAFRLLEEVALNVDSDQSLGIA